MSYFATKDGITKIISKNNRKEYEKLGWAITTDGKNPYDPYDYEDVKENRLEPIIINGEVFTGYSAFFCINTKTYVVEPERTSDGSIPDINEYDTFIVPRVKIAFNYMTIQDFRRFLKATAPNEFLVTYYDYEIGEMVSYKMYIEPREMATIYNKGYEILAITGQEISLIATLNDMEYLNIEYYDTIRYVDLGIDNPSILDTDSDSVKVEKNREYVLYETKQMIFGNYYYIINGNQFTHHYKKENEEDIRQYKFKGWNTLPNGQGINYLSEETLQATNNLKLYAQWEE